MVNYFVTRHKCYMQCTNDEDSLDGVLEEISTNGILNYAILKNGKVKYNCKVQSNTFVNMRHLIGYYLRVYGISDMYRQINGKWTIQNFMITSFEVLDTTPHDQVVDQLRRVPGSEWKTMDDPLGYALQLRGSIDD